ncbi:MAG: sulfotransferase domain-containing protein [Gomphosphaeria aponina SAG 52.96 = DSM 107014]|uniref:Sulfotransferase domain-containing protein n=1 Tax=Gomphosphaeria aponina SAG 52.96 = DSM 107014 TaxID=1521640 RepID=A0A941JNU6_9CHRO|nr:sulfotransferase domain-containing protein [Gomphosphaeria aponina SAG 52.96 = DSM 107014]
MIVYIASYPRSGNSWIQQLIYYQFRRLISSVYQINDYPPPQLNKWKIRIQSQNPNSGNWLELLKEKVMGNICIWNEFIAVYNEPEQEINPPEHRFIMPGCLEFLTEENRQKLAAEANVFFVKTHELPYQKYFTGEKVIQPIRNPGAVIWSYFNLIEATKWPGETFKSLMEVIKGNVRFGSWSDYHEKWLQVGEELGDRYLQIPFEWLKEHQDECCYQIEKLTGLKYLKREFITFEAVHKLNPIAKREGKAFGWEKNYSNEELRLLYACHGKMMEQLNYPEPIYHPE